MIIANLKGGLGNQLFQISTGIDLADRSCTEFCINYNLPHNLVQGNTAAKYKDTLYRDIIEARGMPSVRYAEPFFKYNEIVAKPDMIIDGYFQSEKYFPARRSQLIELFKFPESTVSKVDTVIGKMKNECTVVGVHIRRGDYKTYETTHPLQRPDYYNNAMNKIKDVHPDAKFVLCTDDFESVQSEFNMDDFVYANSTDELMDMCVLSKCDHLIGCNSSFSWWSSYFNTNDGMHIFPSVWFGPDGPQDYEDIFRDNWILI